MGVITTLFLSLSFINPTFATTSNNLYDAKGNLIASCGENGCEYFIYQAVSRVGIVKDNQFTHQANGIDGKAGEMIHDQNGIISSQLWIPDFHGSVIAKLTNEESETILFDAFGGVLNESSNSEEDCQDYHYTDKPRIGCTKLHNFNVRSYDPTLGRFIITDPVEQSNLNWFIYGNNNPLRFIDPDGANPLKNIITSYIDEGWSSSSNDINMVGRYTIVKDDLDNQEQSRLLKERYELEGDIRSVEAEILRLEQLEDTEEIGDQLQLLHKMLDDYEGQMIDIRADELERKAANNKASEVYVKQAQDSISNHPIIMVPPPSVYKSKILSKARPSAEKIRTRSSPLVGDRAPLKSPEQHP